MQYPWETSRGTDWLKPVHGWIRVGISVLKIAYP